MIKRSLPFLISAILGAAIWLASPVVTGQMEPWDSTGGYYWLSLLSGGIISGFLAPGQLWKYYLGAFAGQLICLFLLPGKDALILAGLVFLAGYSVLFVPAAAVGKWLRKKLWNSPKSGS